MIFDIELLQYFIIESCNIGEWNHRRMGDVDPSNVVYGIHE